jgi:hypothetical protein
MPTASIRYDAEFLGAALKRFRRQHPARIASTLVRSVGGIVFGAAAAFLFWVGQPMEALMALLVCLLAVFAGTLNQWLVRRSMAKSPFNGDQLTINFDADGFHAFSKKQDVRLRWEVFTRVAHFRDGFLLFQGPKLFNWIPFSAIEGSAISDLDRLLREHIKEHKIVEQGVAPQPAARSESDFSGSLPPST